MTLCLPILNKVKDVHPGGLFFTLALDQGASPEMALHAASVCEMFYAACSVTDDLQDGDTDEYLGHLPMSLRMNAQVQSICLATIRLSEYAILIDSNQSRTLVSDVFRNLSSMLTGQRKEIVRDPWTMKTYESVAVLSGGKQFVSYMRISCCAAGIVNVDPWLRWAGAFAVLLQYVTDLETHDDRLFVLESKTRESWCKRWVQELNTSQAQLDNSLLERHAKALVRRCDRT
jgi:hypothetical protein